MEDEIRKRVIPQGEAIERISRAIRRSRSGIKDPKRPIGTFIFAGPTGAGKTLLAKRIAEFMFGNEEALATIDMSEYMEKYQRQPSDRQAPQASLVTKRVSSPRRFAVGLTAWCCSMKSRRPTPMSGTCCYRSWKKAA